MPEIVRYTDEREQVIGLLIELQKHLVSVDHEKVQIMNDSYGEEYFAFMFRLVTDNDGVIYLAKEENAIVGLIAGYVEPKDEEDKITNHCPKRGVISDLVVSHSLRSQGIGGELMNAMEQYFSDIGCEFIAVNAFAPNERAQRFYERFGYAPRNVELYKRIIRS